MIATSSDTTVKDTIKCPISDDKKYIWLHNTTNRHWMIIHQNDVITEDLIGHINISTATYALTESEVDELAKRCGVSEWKTGVLY